MKTKHLLIPALALLAFTSCKKESTDNPTATSGASVAYQLQTTNRTASFRTTAGTLQWSSGSAYVTLAKLEALDAASHEVEFKSTLAQQVDLFSAQAPTFANVQLPAGTYNKVEFKMQVDPNGKNPALVLNGQYTTSSGTVIPVSFKINTRTEIKAEQNNVTISATTPTTIVTSLNLALLTSGISDSMISGATLTNGVLVISSSSNSSLYNIIVNNLSRHHESEVHHH